MNKSVNLSNDLSCFIEMNVKDFFLQMLNFHNENIKNRSVNINRSSRGSTIFIYEFLSICMTPSVLT